VTRTHKGPLRDVLAKNMRRLSAERGLSQEALAHECGINRTYLSGVEPLGAQRVDRQHREDRRGLKVEARAQAAATSGCPVPCDASIRGQAASVGQFE
jgi:hypothetical protein